jgi:hypothetical protein
VLVIWISSIIIVLLPSIIDMEAGDALTKRNEIGAVW